MASLRAGCSGSSATKLLGFSPAIHQRSRASWNAANASRAVKPTKARCHPRRVWPLLEIHARARLSAGIAVVVCQPPWIHQAVKFRTRVSLEIRPRQLSLADAVRDRPALDEHSHCGSVRPSAPALCSESLQCTSVRVPGEGQNPQWFTTSSQDGLAIRPFVYRHLMLQMLLSRPAD